MNIRKYDWMPLLSWYPKKQKQSKPTIICLNNWRQLHLLEETNSYLLIFSLVNQLHLLQLGWALANKLLAKTQFQSHTDHLKNLTICVSWKGDVKMSISNILMKLQTNLSQSPLQSRMKGKVDRNLKNSMGKLLEEKKRLLQTTLFSGRE